MRALIPKPYPHLALPPAMIDFILPIALPLARKSSNFIVVFPILGYVHTCFRLYYRKRLLEEASSQVPQNLIVKCPF